jgi:hypothetical protein
MSTLDALLDQWRQEAETCRRLGADGTALAVERCAKDLEEWTKARELETLTLADVAAESGLSYSAVQRAVREGRLPNAGTPGHPRVRRVEVPKKASRRARLAGVPDLVALVSVGRCDPARGADRRPSRSDRDAQRS